MIAATRVKMELCGSTSIEYLRQACLVDRFIFQSLILPRHIGARGLNSNVRVLKSSQ